MDLPSDPDSADHRDRRAANASLPGAIDWRAAVVFGALVAAFVALVVLHLAGVVGPEGH